MFHRPQLPSSYFVVAMAAGLFSLRRIRGHLRRGTFAATDSPAFQGYACLEIPSGGQGLQLERIPGPSRRTLGHGVSQELPPVPPVLRARSIELGSDPPSQASLRKAKEQPLRAANAGDLG